MPNRISAIDATRSTATRGDSCDGLRRQADPQHPGVRAVRAPRPAVWRPLAMTGLTALTALTAATAIASVLFASPAARAQLSVGISLPGLSIGLNVPVYPTLVRVPGYPVYWDPQGAANYFFLDGLYWVYRGDNWYQSTWYNGPWRNVDRYDVPVYLLRVPVRYYRQPPAYFRGGRADAPPRWGEHWGPAWQQRRPDWDRWDRRTAPAPAPLPVYQREYRGDRYPQAQQQDDIRRYRERIGAGDRNRDADRERDPGRDAGRDAGRDGYRAAPPAPRAAPPMERVEPRPEAPSQGRGREDRSDGPGNKGNGNGHGKGNGRGQDDDRR